MSEIVVGHAELLIDWYEEHIPSFAKKVEPIYKLLAWKWREDLHTPTRHEIERALHELKQHAIEALNEDRLDCRISRGGLCVGWELESSGLFRGIISFELSEEMWWQGKSK